MFGRKDEHRKPKSRSRESDRIRTAAHARIGSLTIFVVALITLPALSGCGRHQIATAPTPNAGRVYYVDGAGGGGSPMNWGQGVREGLSRASMSAEYRQFAWQTGFGTAADQAASVDYKRSKAQELAAEIASFKREYPGQSVNLIALSAGTAVAVFALEALPSDCVVDNVVLLSSSMSATYDLSDALRHVRHRALVFTSDRDAVLRLLVPMSGSADRVYCGTDCAGLRGFHPPIDAMPEPGRQLEKLEQIPWVPEFAALGNHGGHTDAVKAQFVANRIAPLIRGDDISRSLALAPALSGGLALSEVNP